jgi:hypothetical protein
LTFEKLYPSKFTISMMHMLLIWYIQTA